MNSAAAQPLLLLAAGLVIDALFGDIPTLFRYVPHPVVLPRSLSSGRASRGSGGGRLLLPLCPHPCLPRMRGRVGEGRASESSAGNALTTRSV
jgi:hypothetical protein